MNRDRELCLAAGMDEYLAKPLRAAGALLERFLGDRSLLQAVAGTFIDHLPVLLRDVDAAVAAGDLQAIRRAAHSPKGSAGNFGYAPAFESALHLEQLGRAGASEGVPEASAIVHRTMDELVRLLRETIAGK